MIGIGIDAVDVERFRRVLERTPSLAERLFTEDERTYARRRPDPTERLAARFAAKEAVMKAMGVGLGSCAFREIEVVRADSGIPSLLLHGTAAELAAARRIGRWYVSLTHTSLIAQAVVVAE